MSKIHVHFTAACLGLLIACSGKPKEDAKAPAGGETEAATPVETAPVKREAIHQVITADAVLYPVSQANIMPKISAPVRKFFVNRGDHVKQGQVLASLEDRDLVAAAQESKSLYDQAQASFQTTTGATMPDDLTKAQADAQSARQTLDAARKLYDNRVKLVKEGALAQKLADDAQVALVQAQSQVETAQRHLQSLQTVGRHGAAQRRAGTGGRGQSAHAERGGAGFLRGGAESDQRRGLGPAYYRRVRLRTRVRRSFRWSIFPRWWRGRMCR